MNIHRISIIILLITRVLSEIISNFIWKSANYVWSAVVLILISVLFWPAYVLNSYGERRALTEFIPILMYLLYLFFRIDFTNFYSIKCYFSELIVWFFFMYSWVCSNRDEELRERIRKTTIWFIKIILIVGLFQLLKAGLLSRTLNPLHLFELRSVKSIFAHPNIFLVVVLPFLFYFLKQRSYFWVGVVLLTCLATGTRSPFLSLLCLSLMIMKSVLNRKIKAKDIFISLFIVIAVYSILIIYNIQFIGQAFYEGGRLTLSTLQWRIDFWRNFLHNDGLITLFFGHGVGSADQLAAFLIGKDLFYPHNDYLRIFYDTGLLGLILFGNLILYMVRWIYCSVDVENDFILLSFILLICFFITDNFVYCTHSLFIYIFIASFLIDRKLFYKDENLTRQ